jgi:glycosyltransferase involved in cell wall biosynthesis
VLIGDTVSGFEKYAEDCRREGAGFTEFIPAFKHDDPLLSSAYAACKVFVLPGWFETPGLAAMEAAVAGATLAVTQVGSTREYFGDNAEYFDPANAKDMQKKILNALSKPHQKALSQKMLEHYTWERVAAKTMEVYGELAS